MFRYPKNPSVDYIKRLVGLPGDKIGYYNKVLYVNGEPAGQVPAGVYVGKGSGVSFGCLGSAGACFATGFRIGFGFGSSFLTSLTSRFGISATVAERSGIGTFIRGTAVPKTKQMMNATRTARRRRLSLSASLVQGMIVSRL